jgi:hypothetical protein
MKIQIKKRNFSNLIDAGDYDFTVKTYTHLSQGGPGEARIDVKGDELNLWRLVELLRCPITIYTDSGVPVWWGYIDETKATIKNKKIGTKTTAWQVGAAMNSMYNRIAVAYTALDSSGHQSRATTDWLDDDSSQLEYGVRELLLTNSGSTQEHAEYAREVKLDQCKYPQATVIPANNSDTTGEIICKGWWNTLGWQYYANASTDSTDTSDQVGAICTASGQFFENVFVEAISGVNIPETKDGDGTALTEAKELLKMGTTGRQRLLALVDAYRNVRIYAEPYSNPAYKFYSDGRIEDYYGAPVDPAICLCGVWARWVDVIPPSVNSNLLAEPALIFIESGEYDAQAGIYTPTPRGYPDPFDFMVVQNG